MEGQIISPVTSWYILSWGMESNLCRVPKAICLLLQRSNPLQQSLKRLENFKIKIIIKNKLFNVVVRSLF